MSSGRDGISGGEIIVITGIMAAGQSTVAQALAERLPCSVHLRGDLFRRMIVNGQAAMTPDSWDDAVYQLHLRQKIAVGVAHDYANAGFAVCYQDIVLGDDLSRVVQALDPTRQPVSVVVLVPTSHVAAERDRQRAKTGYGDWTPEALDAELRERTPRLGFWIDTSALTVDETVDAILRERETARIT